MQSVYPPTYIYIASERAHDGHIIRRSFIIIIVIVIIIMCFTGFQDVD